MGLALSKIVRALPEGVAAQAEAVRRTTAPAPDRSAARPDPWAVVVRHGRWYLPCWSHRSSGTRAYRIDRVRAVGALPFSFAPPADLDPVTELEAHLGVGWEYDTEVVVDAPVEEVLRVLARVMGRLEPVDDPGQRPTRSRMPFSSSSSA